MKPLRNCPGCKSSNISGAISVDKGRYVQRIICRDCPYQNHRDIGSAIEHPDTGIVIDEE